MNYRDLQDFQRGYTAAMLWANTYGEDENGSIVSAGDGIPDVDYTDLTEETADALDTDCVDFLTVDSYAGAGLVIEAIEGPVAYSWEQAGHDFALTRNHHGAGFWDRGLGAVGEVLTERAESMGERNLYVTEDGKVIEE